MDLYLLSSSQQQEKRFSTYCHNISQGMLFFQLPWVAEVFSLSEAPKARRPRRGAQGTSSQRSLAPSEKSLGPKVSSSQPPLPPPSKIKKQTKTKQKKISQEGIGQSIGYSIPTFSNTLDRRDL